MKDDAETLQTHVAEAFSEWISHLHSFCCHPSPAGGGLVMGHGCFRKVLLRSRMEYTDHPMPHLVSNESESMPPLVGSAPSSTAWMGQVKEGGGHTPRVPTSWPREDPQGMPCKG